MIAITRIRGTFAAAFLFVFAFVCLFGGNITSHAIGGGDRKSPTTPTNLTVTGRTETTIALTWRASTDNSGSLSYRVRINDSDNPSYNSIATVSQLQTTYTAKFLPPNNTFILSVYAVDAAGNRSSDSNAVTAQTLADTTGPTKPNLEAASLGPSEVRLSWTRAVDNVSNNCCTYGIMMNGGPVTQNVNWWSDTSVVIRHLTPGSTYTFQVSASDFNGNAVTSNFATAATQASTDTVAPSAPTNLHLVADNSCAEVWLGWTESTDDTDAPEDIEYEIYVNNVISPLPVSSGVNMDFVYGTAFGDNTFYIKAVDRSGNTSAASGPLKLYLWPC